MYEVTVAPFLNCCYGTNDFRPSPAWRFWCIPSTSFKPCCQSTGILRASPEWHTSRMSHPFCSKVILILIAQGANHAILSGVNLSNPMLGRVQFCFGLCNNYLFLICTNLNSGTIQCVVFAEKFHGIFLFSSVSNLYPAVINPPTPRKGIVILLPSVHRDNKLVLIKQKWILSTQRTGIHLNEPNTNVQGNCTVVLPGVGLSLTALPFSIATGPHHKLARLAIVSRRSQSPEIIHAVR